MIMKIIRKSPIPFLKTTYFTTLLVFLLPIFSEAAGHNIPGPMSLQSILWWFQARIWFSIVPVFFVLAVFLFLWGLAVFILNAGNEEKRSEGKKRMMWGIIAIFVIFSIWAIVKILQLTFFGTLDLPGTIFSPDFQ